MKVQSFSNQFHLPAVYQHSLREPNMLICCQCLCSKVLLTDRCRCHQCSSRSNSSTFHTMYPNHCSSSPLEGTHNLHHLNRESPLICTSIVYSCIWAACCCPNSHTCRKLRFHQDFLALGRHSNMLRWNHSCIGLGRYFSAYYLPSL